mmetsp:Transcript_88883/g.229277  ORF Transcript_88883/g.229277 Transcript_88883/m.229277 type:complete len:239 (+) Transcript_88883:1090-1806(+)
MRPLATDELDVLLDVLGLARVWEDHRLPRLQIVPLHLLQVALGSLDPLLGVRLPPVGGALQLQRLRHGAVAAHEQLVVEGHGQHRLQVGRVGLKRLVDRERLPGLPGDALEVAAVVDGVAETADETPQLLRRLGARHARAEHTQREVLHLRDHVFHPSAVQGEVSGEVLRVPPPRAEHLLLATIDPLRRVKLREPLEEELPVHERLGEHPAVEEQARRGRRTQLLDVVFLLAVVQRAW